ncbi:MAG: thrombospondin type 3 repeat-containing protein, partial [Nanoarchaeota archaeon]
AYTINGDSTDLTTLIVKDKVPPACSDADGDGVCNDKDNCDTHKNADQLDTDKDGAGNVCDDDDDGDGVKDPKDNCPLFANPAQEDKDKDGIGDTCDSDWDGDNVPNSKDNCAKTYNPNQSDIDGDGWGDACDTDDDNDGIIDEWDDCPTEKGVKENNGCPKVEPIVNKAPVMDNIDAHNKNVKEGKSLSFVVSAADDGIPQRLTYEVEKVTASGGSFFSFSNAWNNLWKLWKNDQLPSYAKFDETTNTFTIAPFYNFVKHPELSEKVTFKFRAYDGDKYSNWEYTTINVNDVNQNPKIAFLDTPSEAVVGQKLSLNTKASDLDGDALKYSWNLGNGKVLENAGELVGNVVYSAPGNYLITLTISDAYGGKDTFMDLITIKDEPLLDTDGDGVPNVNDNCPDKANADQKDTDGDGIGDVCDEVIPVDNDKDDDGITDDKDNCPTVANPTQSDIDGDGVGDVC